MGLVETTLYTISEKQASLLDADWSKSYGLIVASKNGEDLEVKVNNQSLPLPESIQSICFPLVRWIDHLQFLLVDVRNEPNKENLCILDLKGQIPHSFNAGMR